MSLSEVVSRYVASKQSMGMRFHTESRTLKSFCKAMGDIGIADVQPVGVQSFLAGTGPITRFWQRKHEVLRGFYRFAVARGYTAVSPLPARVPHPRAPLCHTSSPMNNCGDCSTRPLQSATRAVIFSPIPAVC